MRSCLILDADPDARGWIEDAVRAAGKGVTDVHHAADVEEGMRLFAERSPDVAFVDLALLGHDQLQRMMESRPHAPVVVLTGRPGTDPSIADAISLGALAAMRKPGSFEEVRFVLEAIDPERPAMDYHG